MSHELPPDRYEIQLYAVPRWAEGRRPAAWVKVDGPYSAEEWPVELARVREVLDGRFRVIKWTPELVATAGG